MRRAAIVAALLAAGGDARAGGFAVAEQSATAGGTAGAGTARADDPSAAWYDPALLPDGRGWRIGFGLLAARPSLHAGAEDGSWSTANEAAWATPPHLHLSFSGGAFAFGVAAGVPFGSGVAWPDDWPGRYEIVQTRLEVFRAAPFLAWRRGRLGLAGGVHVDRARLRVDRKLDFIDTEGDVHVDLAGSGAGVDAALAFAASPRLTLGLTYKSRTRIHLEGGADFETPDAFSAKTADQRAGAEITLPDRIAAGVAWRRGRVTALADVELMLWGTWDALVVDFANEETPDAMQVSDWSATVALRAGAEWRRRAWVVRGGAFLDPSPAGDDTLAPSSPDSTRVGATAGLTRAIGRRFQVDAFAEYLQLLGRSAENEEHLAASYGGHAWLVGVGVRWTAR